MVQSERCPMTWGKVCRCRRTLKRDEHGPRFILHRGMRAGLACPGNVGCFPVARCEYSCAYYYQYAHTRLRVHRAPGIPHALCFQGGD